ncbi:hypothetical protein LWF02_10465, partial [Clostridioides difficile]|nr:hypothetical protein [Clostridioides difficile]
LRMNAGGVPNTCKLSDEKAKEIINKNFEEDEKFVCPECGSEGIAHTGGCSICLKCGYSGCN